MKKPFGRVPLEIPISQLTPLNIVCGSTKCGDDLHCFQTSKKSLKQWGQAGVCKECGVKLIDWERVHKNNIGDAQFIISSLKYELIRHVFWHTQIEEKAVNKALKLGSTNLRTKAGKILEGSIGKANNFREGYQTPKKGSEIVNYAQHATATCCRKCLEYWHNIKMGKKLTAHELEFCTDLIMLYVNAKVPKLTENGAKQ